MSDHRKDGPRPGDRPADRPLDRGLAAAAGRYHEPPATPRDEMWDRIQAVRTGAEAQPIVPKHAARVAPLWRRRVVLWPAAAAAILLLGVAIGRLTLPGAGTLPVPGSGPRELAANGDSLRNEGNGFEAMPVAAAADQSFYRFAATPLLSRSEALLLQMTTGAGKEAGKQVFSARAAVLLAETRLLLDSPAASDADLKALLEDLELTLARVVTIAADQRATEQPSPDQLVGGQGVADRKVLEEGLTRQSILPRLRSHLAAGASPSSL